MEDFDVNIDVCLYKMQKKVVKKWLLEGKRVDGRRHRRDPPARRRGRRAAARPRLRPVHPEARRRSLSVCTLNTLSAAQKLDTIYPEDDEALYPPLQLPVVLHRRSAVQPAPPPAARLATARWLRRRLLPVIPSVEEFPYCHPRRVRGPVLQRLDVAGFRSAAPRWH